MTFRRILILILSLALLIGAAAEEVVPPPEEETAAAGTAGEEEIIPPPEEGEPPEAEIPPEWEALLSPYLNPGSAAVMTLDRRGDNGTVRLALGDSLQLVPLLAAQQGWTVRECVSGKPSVAEVSASARVTGLKKGKAKVTLKCTNGSRMTVTVEVYDPEEPLELKLGASEMTMAAGETIRLTPEVFPDTARAVLGWKSSSPRVVAVSEGQLTALKEGTSRVTVTARNGVRARIKVRVIDPDKAEGIAFDIGGTAVLELGKTLRLTPVIRPETARPRLEWTSSRPSVAAVDADGLVTPKKAGETKITVRTHNGKKARVKVKVVDPTVPTGVRLDASGTIQMKLGESRRLRAALEPDTAAGALTWKSSRPSVVTVSAEGVLEAKKKGSATITVVTANGRKAKVKVRVAEE